VKTEYNLGFYALLAILLAVFAQSAVHAELFIHVLLMFPFMSTVHVDIVCLVFGSKLVAL
jgi:hypothetical protein